MAGIKLRDDYSAADLRRLARKARDGKQARRLMALSGMRDGLSRTDATSIGLMDRQTLRDRCPAGYAEHAREEGRIGSMKRVPRV